MNMKLRIKSLRKQLGMSQEAFAKKLGVNFVTVNRWENGHCYPSPLACLAILGIKHQLMTKRIRSHK